MDQIARIALKAQLNIQDDKHLDGIIEVMNATSNNQVALEILLGVYNAPENLETPSEKFLKSNNKLSNVEFISYDKFSQRVEYSYQVKIPTYSCINRETSECIKIYTPTDRNSGEYEFRNSIDGFNYDKYEIKTEYSEDVFEKVVRSTESITTWHRD